MSRASRTSTYFYGKIGRGRVMVSGVQCHRRRGRGARRSGRPTCGCPTAVRTVLPLVVPRGCRVILHRARRSKTLVAAQTSRHSPCVLPNGSRCIFRWSSRRSPFSPADVAPSAGVLSPGHAAMTFGELVDTERTNEPRCRHPPPRTPRRPSPRVVAVHPGAKGMPRTRMPRRPPPPLPANVST